MLSNSPVCATIGVKDMQKAKDFYENTLRLKPAEGEMNDPGGVLYASGNSRILVYESQYGGTNEATSASWMVDDVDKEVSDLKDKGVSFEHYDFPDTKREGDIHMYGGMKSAWFKDPDGNILNMTSKPA